MVLVASAFTSASCMMVSMEILSLGTSKHQDVLLLHKKRKAAAVCTRRVKDLETEVATFCRDSALWTIR